MGERYGVPPPRAFVISRQIAHSSGEKLRCRYIRMFSEASYVSATSLSSMQNEIPWICSAILLPSNSCPVVRSHRVIQPSHSPSTVIAPASFDPLPLNVNKLSACPRAVQTGNRAISSPVEIAVSINSWGLLDHRLEVQHKVHLNFHQARLAFDRELRSRVASKHRSQITVTPANSSDSSVHSPPYLIRTFSQSLHQAHCSGEFSSGRACA